MIGRDLECQVIDGLLTSARADRSGALVLHGEPGVGKSMLLEYAADNADGMLVLRCVGTETESNLAYGGVHQLLRPLIDLVDRLPAPQQDGLHAVFGFTIDRRPDRFLVGAAVLTLLSEAAAEDPVLCLIDDSQWLDRASADVLAFVARRLEAEGVVLLAATRREPPAVPGLLIGGLDRAAAAELLNSHGAELSSDLMDRLIEETSGNPLALLELADTVTNEQLADRGPLPLTERIQQAFADRVDGLPEAARRLLLVAAADDTGNLSTITRAAETLGALPEALDAAEQASLVRLEGTSRLTFRHPLVRSAIYLGAAVAERLSAHRALADAVGDQLDRRVWHLAASTLGTDEAVAADLEAIAEKSSRLGGYDTASAALERSAELSDTEAARSRRLAAAAQAAYDAGQIDRAAALIRRTEPLLDDPPAQARLTALRGTVELRHGSMETAHGLLLDAASGLAVADPEQAVVTLIEIGWAALSAREPRYVAELAAGFAELQVPAGHRLAPVVAIHLGLGEFVAGRSEVAFPQIRAGVDELLRQIELGQADDLADYLGQVTFLQEPLLAIGDHPVALDLGRAEVASCRSRGQVGRLPMSLAGLAHVEMHSGHHPSARTHASEALRLARDLGQDNVVCLCEGILASLAAVQGPEEEARRHITEAIHLSEATQLLWLAGLRPRWLGLLDLTLGRPESAFDQLSGAVPAAGMWTHFEYLPDVVEAAARAGDAASATEHLARYEHWATQTGQPWAEAVLHRSRALLTTDADDAERHFDAAVRRHHEAGERDRPHQRARTQLLYGEWLRRGRRRADARTQLAAAHATFDRLGDTAWVDRAATELRATGQTVRRPELGALPKLTPQELSIARLAAEGGTNKEIAAQLFLSPRTVGHHLSSAFRKLDITSRRQLMRLDLDAV